MYTGVFGAGLIWFIGRPDVPARRGLGAGLMLTAMLMHGLWDASAAIAGDNVASIVPAAVAFVLISVFIWVYENSVGIEREWMRELMAPEVRLGVVEPDELEALAGTRSRLKNYVRSQRNPRATARVLEAETELAHQIARDGGAETEAVGSARAAVARARAT
jgi:protease PrsW